MLGLGRSLFSHLWAGGGSAPRLKKQVSSPLGSLMLRFTDNKLKRKPDSEISVSKRTSPGKTCMTCTVINMPDGQCRQRGVFSPSGEGRSHQQEAATTCPGRLQDRWWPRTLKCSSISLLGVQSHALLHYATRELFPRAAGVSTSGSSAQR